MAYLPFKPTKNTQFTLYLSLTQLAVSNSSGAAGAIILSAAPIASTTFTISKDGGAFASLSNAVTDLGNGSASVVLTASEMNADVVIVRANYLVTGSGASRNSAEEKFIMYTTTGSGAGLTAQEVWEYATRTITASGSGLSLDDVIDVNVGIPGGDLTLRQVFALIGKRIKRTGHRI